jgi:hypothetical protein
VGDKPVTSAYPQPVIPEFAPGTARNWACHSLEDNFSDTFEKPEEYRFANKTVRAHFYEGNIETPAGCLFRNH